MLSAISTVDSGEIHSPDMKFQRPIPVPKGGISQGNDLPRPQRGIRDGSPANRIGTLLAERKDALTQVKVGCAFMKKIVKQGSRANG